MSKQGTLDKYIKKINSFHPKKNTKEPTRKNHQSSLQGSQATVRLSQDEQVVQLQVFNGGKMTCPVFILLTPSAMTYYTSIQRSLKEFSNLFNKQNVLDFIKKNMKIRKIDNLLNLQKINDDQFWHFAVPEMIELTCNRIDELGCKVEILTKGFQGVRDLTKMQLFLIISSMFFGILPKQVHQDCVHMGELMTIRENEQNQKKILTRRQKLKCFLAYFRAVTQNKQLLKGNVRFQRTKNTNLDFFDPYKIDREVPLRAVQIKSISDIAIEDYCGKGIMIDFANHKLGGGVLRNGCVQEQILFSIFPQAMVSKIICQPLEDNQAVIIYGARRFSKYQGYSDSFQFKGLAKEGSESQAEKSVIVAIDATDFNSIPNLNYQYSKKAVRRELCKANIGFEGASLQADQDMPVVTGRWGCGAFRGDEQLKFLIQWIAASEASRQMIYITESKESVKHFELAYEHLRKGCTSDLLGILEQYGKARPFNKNPLSLMQYIKNYT